MGNWCIQDALVFGRDALAAEQEEAVRESEILLQHALKVSRTYLYAHSEDRVSDEQTRAYCTMIQQRQAGTPIAYIIGYRSFWTFDIAVTEATLIPRADTEVLVERTLALTDPTHAYTLLDLGTGSGAIALAVASERPHWRITACDQSAQALAVAQHNARTLKLDHIQFILSDWLQAFSQQKFDIIVANPPYIATSDPHLQQGDLRFEPQSALVSAQNGLDALHTIIRDGHSHLNAQGLLLVEHGHTQSDAVCDLFRHYGYQNIQSWRDIQGLDRVCSGRRT